MIKYEKLMDVYVLITLFIGLSMTGYLGLALPEGHFLGSFHYLSLPFLLFVTMTNYGKIQFNTPSRFFLFLAVIELLISAIIYKESASFGFWTCLLIEPVLLCAILQISSDKFIKRCRFYIILFILVEFIIASYEALTHTVLFYAKLESVDSLGDFRACALHGHGLANSFLIVWLALVLMYAEIKNTYRYMLVFISIIALLAFNSRSYTYLALLIIAFKMILDYSKGKSLTSKISIVLLLGVGYVAFNYILGNSSLGSRLSLSGDYDGGSAGIRLYVLEYALNQNISAILLGSGLSVINSFYRNTFFILENSVVILFLRGGLLLVVAFFVGLYNFVYYIVNIKKLTMLFIVVFFAELNVNNIINDVCPIMEVLVISLFAFRPKSEELCNSL